MTRYPDPATIGNTIVDSNTWTRLARFMNSRYLFVENPDYAGGAKGDGSTDDYAAITACIADSAPGDVILFRPGATYITSQPIRRKTERAYVGGMLGIGAWMNLTTLKVKDGSSANFTGTNGHSGVFVPESWDTNLTTSQGREVVMGFAIDGNRANNATGNHHGLIMHGNFWSHYQNLRIYECRKDGIHMTPYGKNNSSLMAAGLSDFTMRDIMVVNNGGSGIFNRLGTNGSYHSDMVWDGNILSFNNDVHGVWSENSGGWAFDGTLHQWDNGKSGAVFEGAYGFRMAHYYGESMGRLGVSGDFLYGLRIVVFNGRAAFLHDCHQTVTAPITGVTHIGYSLVGRDTNAHIWANDMEALQINGTGGANEYGFEFWSGDSGTHNLGLHHQGLHAHGFQDETHRYNYLGSGVYAYNPPREVTATATWDMASTATGAVATTTITVPGAAVGDEVLVSYSTLTQAGAITISGRVTAANTVTVTVRNDSGSTIDPGSGTLRATARKRS